MMPRGAAIATAMLLAAGACAPGEFVWPGREPEALPGYRASFQAAAGERFTGSLPRAEVLGRLRRERLLWLGDNHHSARLHGLQNELLAQLHAAGIRLAFALEAIGTQDEPQVELFLRGETSLDELRAAMRRRWRGSWLDDLELDRWHYRSLLSFAQRHRLPVHAVEPTPRLPLAERDEVIADAVRTLLDRWPDRLLVVHVGQAHLVGSGDLVARTGRGGFVLGAEPTPALQRNRPAAAERGSLWQSDGGLWWFGELLASPGQDDAGAGDRRAAWPSTSSAATR
ncbi:MAG: ChaN family lipoprotein [Planctomycetes bacterium]|nr:ChaN family lipoprotein [Planctomycetota bacterium]